MEAVPVIAWFRTRKQLHADIDRQRDMLTARDIEIRDLHQLLGEQEDREGQRITALQESLNHTRGLLDGHRQRNAQLVEELRSLRDDIARREQAETEAQAYMPVRGFGMARPVDTAAVHDALRRQRERRIGSQVDAVFGIDEEAAAKRQADGLGDL